MVDKRLPVRMAILACIFTRSTQDTSLCAFGGPALTGFVLQSTDHGQRARVSWSLPLPYMLRCTSGDRRAAVVARGPVLRVGQGARYRGRTSLGQMKDDDNAGAPRRRLGASRAPSSRRPQPRAPIESAAPVKAIVDSRELTMLRKIMHGCVAAITVVVGFVLGVVKLVVNVFNYFFQRKRRPLAAYIASWIVHRVLVSVCQEVQGLQVRVDAESSLKLLGGEVTGITIMASRVRLLDVSVGDVGIYTDDVRFVQAARNGSLSEKLMSMGATSSSSDGVMEIITPPTDPLVSVNSDNRDPGRRPDRADAVPGDVLAARQENYDSEGQISEEMGNREGNGWGEEQGAGGLTVAEPFAASLVASLTEKDVNDSPPIMYILKELLTFLVRFGLSIGARKTLGGDQWREESFNSTAVELSYVKLCSDNTLRVEAALTLDRKSGPQQDAPAKLPLTIRLGLDLQDDGRCIIVRQPEIVTRGPFQREVFVPFMPLARSGADLGPDFHLSKLKVNKGLIEAEGIVVVRPPASLRAEQEITKLEGVGVALESEIDELRRIEMEKRERDSMEKGSHVDRQRMQVEGEIRMSRWRAAERRRRRNQRLMTVTEATRRALIPLDSLRAQVNMSAMGTYVNTSAYAAYLRGMNVSAYVNASVYARYLSTLNRTRLGEYSTTSSEALRRMLNSSYSTLQSTYSSVGPFAAALTGSLSDTPFLASLKSEYSLEEALMLQQEMEEVQRLAGVTNASQAVRSVGGRWADSGELMRASSLMRGNSTASLLRAITPAAGYTKASQASQSGVTIIGPVDAEGARFGAGCSQDIACAASARVGQAETDDGLQKIDVRTALSDEALRALLWPAAAVEPGGRVEAEAGAAGRQVALPLVGNDDEPSGAPASAGAGVASDDAALRRLLWPTPTLAKEQQAAWKGDATVDSGQRQSRGARVASWVRNVWAGPKTRGPGGGDSS